MIEYKDGLKLPCCQDRYTPDAGKHDPSVVIYCGVCGDLMDARFGANGPRSYVEAISKSGSPHDVYTCPSSSEPWHEQVCKLRRLAGETPSRILEEQLLAEAADIVRSRVFTKSFTVHDYIHVPLEK